MNRVAAQECLWVPQALEDYSMTAVRYVPTTRLPWEERCETHQNLGKPERPCSGYRCISCHVDTCKEWYKECPNPNHEFESIPISLGLEWGS